MWEWLEKCANFGYIECSCNLHVERSRGWVTWWFNPYQGTLYVDLYCAMHALHCCRKQHLDTVRKDTTQSSKYSHVAMGLMCLADFNSHCCKIYSLCYRSCVRILLKLHNICNVFWQFHIRSIRCNYLRLMNCWSTEIHCTNNHYPAGNHHANHFYRCPISRS